MKDQIKHLKIAEVQFEMAHDMFMRGHDSCGLSELASAFRSIVRAMLAKEEERKP